MKEDTLESIKYGSDLVIFVATVGLIYVIACIKDGAKYMEVWIAICGVTLVVAIVVDIISTIILKKRQKDLYMSIYTIFKVLSKVGLDDNIDEVNSMSKKQRRTKLWKAFSKGPWLPYIPDVLKYISIMFVSTLCLINTIICHYGGRGFWTRPLQSEFWGSIIFYVILDICLIFYVYFSSLRAKKRPASLFCDLKRENMTFDEASEIFDSAKKVYFGMWDTERYLFYIQGGMGRMISKEDIEHIYIDKDPVGYSLCIESELDSIRRFSLEPFSLNRARKIISE